MLPAAAETLHLGGGPAVFAEQTFLERASISDYSVNLDFHEPFRVHETTDCHYGWLGIV